MSSAVWNTWWLLIWSEDRGKEDAPGMKWQMSLSPAPAATRATDVLKAPGIHHFPASRFTCVSKPAALVALSVFRWLPALQVAVDVRRTAGGVPSPCAAHSSVWLQPFLKVTPCSFSALLRYFQKYFLFSDALTNHGKSSNPCRWDNTPGWLLDNEAASRSTLGAVFWEGAGQATPIVFHR